MPFPRAYTLKTFAFSYKTGTVFLENTRMFMQTIRVLLPKYTYFQASPGISCWTRARISMQFLRAHLVKYTDVHANPRRSPLWKYTYSCILMQFLRATLCEIYQCSWKSGEPSPWTDTYFHAILGCNLFLKYITFAANPGGYRFGNK